MAIKRRRVNYTFAKTGDCVRSKKIGAKEAFDAKIVEVKAAHAVVRDCNGDDWVREWRELEGV